MSAVEYYDHTTYPATSATLSSSPMRSELDLIEAGFGKLPDLAGNGGKIVAVNSGGTGLESLATTGTGNAVRATSPTLTTPVIGATTFTGVGAYAVTFTFTGITGVTFPTTGTLATRAGSETLTNKTIDAATNTLTGVTAAYTDNSTTLATTAWAKFGFSASLGSSGYLAFPTWLGGLIIQWGFTTIAAAGVAQADPFPLTWPTGCYRMAGSMGNTGSAVTSAVNIGPLSTTQYRTVCATPDVVSWIAVGK